MWCVKVVCCVLCVVCCVLCVVWCGVVCKGVSKWCVVCGFIMDAGVGCGMCSQYKLLARGEINVDPVDFLIT